MSDTQHPLGAAWYGRHRHGCISNFSIGTANPVVKRNYCLRSHLRGLVFTLNHIAVAEDSAIVFVHDSDQRHENDHWRRRRRPHPRRWGWWRPRRRWRWRPLRPKAAFPLRMRPLVPTAESWGARPVRRLSRGGIGVLGEPPVSR